MSLKRTLDQYRHAIEVCRDESLPDNTREAAQDDATRLRCELDEAYIANIEGNGVPASRAVGMAYGSAGRPGDQELRAMLAPIDPQHPQNLRVELPVGFESRTEYPLLAGDGGAGAYGSYAVPDSSVHALAVTAMVGESAVLRAKPRVITTTSGEPLDIPVVLAAGMPDAAYRATEATDATQDTIILTKATLSTYELAGYLEVGENFLSDTGLADAYNWISEVIGAGLGGRLAAELLHGTGSSAIQGALYGATSGVTAAAVDSVTFDELLALRASVGAQYRGPQAAWIMTQDLFDDVLMYKDDTGNYLFQPALQAGEPDRMYGHSVYVDANGLAMATGRKCVGFGRWDQAYAVRFAGGLQIESSDAPKYTSWIRTFRYRLRVGAGITNSAAAKVITLA